MERPDTSYAWNGGVCLAYQVVGDGALDLLYVQGYCSNVDLAWEGPRLLRFLRGLAAHGRLILTDRRGWGCSDRFSAHDVQDVDAYVDDLGIVLDATRSERAVIVASGESALLGCLFVAAHPSRTAGLVLIDAFPTYAWTPDTPWAPTPEQWREAAAGIRDHWGTRAWVDRTSAGQVDKEELDWLARYMLVLRTGALPALPLAVTRRSWEGAGGAKDEAASRLRACGPAPPATARTPTTRSSARTADLRSLRPIPARNARSSPSCSPTSLVSRVGATWWHRREIHR